MHVLIEEESVSNRYHPRTLCSWYRCPLLQDHVITKRRFREFYADANVEDYIQLPWNTITVIGANVSGKKIGRHFEVFTDQGKFLFASKDTGKILKIAREHLGNEKVVKLPTLLQTISKFFQNLFAKK